MRQFVAPIIGTVSIVAFAVNETEEFRIARAIKKGKFRPKYTKVFPTEFSQFDSQNVKVVVNKAPAKFCGLIGVNSTGKSAELHTFGSNDLNNNIFFCELNGKQSTELDDIHMKPCTRVC